MKMIKPATAIIAASIAMAGLVWIISKHKSSTAPLTLTVIVDEKQVSKVQVYRGVPEGGLDFSTGQVTFPNATLVEDRAIKLSQKNLNNGTTSEWWAINYTEVVFILHPGRYFVYPISKHPPGF